MTFKQYLKSRVVNIKIKHLYKANDVYVNENENEFSLLAKRANWNASLEKDDIYKLFMNFIDLGKRLYLINKNKIIKFKIFDSFCEVYEARFEKFLVTRNDYDDFTKKELREWLEKEEYCLEEDKDLDYDHFIETNCLIDLSIFSYLIAYSVKNTYDKKSRNHINFDTFIIVEGKNNINKFNYLSIINTIMREFERSKKDYIREESELIYEKDFNELRMYRVFENIYSLFWYILKFYLSYISVNSSDDVFTRVCACGESYLGNNKKCDRCKKTHNTERRKKNRENKKNISYINILLKGNSFPEDIQVKIDTLLANNPNKYENNARIKSILTEMEKHLNYK